MPAPLRYDLSTTQTIKLYGRAGYKAGATPQVQVGGTWSGQIVFYCDTNPHGGVVSGTEPTGLTTWPYKVAGNYTPTLPAASPVIRNDAYEFNTGGLPLWAVVTISTGTVTLTVIPDAVATPAPASVNLSNGLTLDAVPVGYPEDLAFQFRLASDGAMQG